MTLLSVIIITEIDTCSDYSSVKLKERVVVEFIAVETIASIGINLHIMYTVQGSFTVRDLNPMKRL